MKVTGASEEDFLEMIQYGHGPTITATRPDEEQTSSATGINSGDSNFQKSTPDIIYVSQNKAALFQASVNWVLADRGSSAERTEVLDRNLFILAAAVMHEATHRGLYMNNPARFAAIDEQGDDQGAIFELLAFKDRFSYRPDKKNYAPAQVKSFLARNRGEVVLQGLALSNRYGGSFNGMALQPILTSSSLGFNSKHSKSSHFVTGTGAKGMKKIN